MADTTYVESARPRTPPPDLISRVDNDRERAVALFRQLSLDEQVHLVRAAPVERWHDLITLTEDSSHLVRCLSVPELHRLVSVEDLDTSGPLLATASPEQVRGVMDFACWRGDRLDKDESVQWLEWMANLPDEACAERIRTLDAAFLAVVLGPHLKVNPPSTDEGEFTVYQTGIYSLPIAFDYDDDLIEWLVHRLYEVDRRLYDDVITAIFRDGWTLERGTHRGLADRMSEAQERRASRLSHVRLQDTYGARVDLLRPLEMRVAERGRRFSTSLPEPEPARSLLHRLLESADDPTRQEALARLAVHVLMARGGDPANERELRAAAEVMQSALGIALDTLSGGSVFMAEVIAKTWDWTDLFRAGYTLIENLRARAEALDYDLAIRGAQSLWVRGLFEVPLRIYDPHADRYRQPRGFADIIRGMQAVGRAEREMLARRRWRG